MPRQERTGFMAVPAAPTPTPSTGGNLVAPAGYSEEVAEPLPVVTPVVSGAPDGGVL